MNIKFYFIISIIFLAPFSVSSSPTETKEEPPLLDFEYSGGWKHLVRYDNLIKRSGKEGISHLHQGYLKPRFTINEEWKLQIDIAGSFVPHEDDGEVEKVYLDNLVVQLEKEDLFQFTFGDISPNLSYYTWQHKIEGAMGFFDLHLGGEKKIRITSSAGQLPRNFTSAPRKMVYGYKLAAMEFFPGLVVAVDQSFFSQRDEDNPPPDISVMSFNSSWKLQEVPGLEIYSDIAHSFFPERNKEEDDAQKDGWGVRVGSSFKSDNSQLHFEFENVTPDFHSPVGANKKDNRSLKMKGQHKFAHVLDTGIDYHFVRNNLDGAKTETTRTHQPSWNVTLQPFRDWKEEYLNQLELKQRVGFTKKYNKKQLDNEAWNLAWTLLWKWQGFTPQFTYNFSHLRNKKVDEDVEKTQNVKVELRHKFEKEEGKLQLENSVFYLFSQKEFGDEEERRDQVVGANTKYSQNFAGGVISASISFEYKMQEYVEQAEKLKELHVLSTLAYDF